MHTIFAVVSSDLLMRMNTAYSSKLCKFPLSHLCNLIGGKGLEEMKSLLVSHGLTVKDKFVQFSKSTWRS